MVGARTRTHFQIRSTHQPIEAREPVVQVACGLGAARGHAQRRIRELRMPTTAERLMRTVVVFTVRTSSR
ncbi:hypothetical protein GCM10009767_28150 [Kocuria aegyptia]|uniref:Uncharacterized protein n=1 Tax=Kocuria aegyptia TaxID=330943 RepID=A0ABP4X1P9_9MICC